MSFERVSAVVPVVYSEAVAGAVLPGFAAQAAGTRLGIDAVLPGGV